MYSNYGVSCTHRDDLFELVWEQEGQDGGASGPAVSRLRSRRFSNPPPDVRFEPPSEDEMAAWLISAIVKGDELVCNDDGGRQPMADDSWDVPMMGTTATATNKKQKVTPEGKMGTEVRTFIYMHGYYVTNTRT
jgi:hypothetical protein